MTKTVVMLFSLFVMNQIAAQSYMISSEKALEDLEEFKTLLETRSSYIQLTDYDYKQAIADLQKELKQQEEISLFELSSRLSHIVYAIGDRHSKVEFKDFDKDEIEIYRLYFPMALAVHDGRIIGLKRSATKGQFEVYDNDYPYLKTINGLSVEDFLKQYYPRHITAPKAAYLKRAAEDISWKIGRIYVLNNINRKDVDLVMTNGEKDKNYHLSLVKRGIWYKNRANLAAKYEDEIDAEQYDKLSFWLKKDIAYFAIPAMYNFEDTPQFKEHLEQSIKQFKDAKAWIIDIRGNGGGSREILNLLAPYIVQPQQSPWVANVAHIRTDETWDRDVRSRYLYRYNASQFSAKDRAVIDHFMKDFKATRAFDKSKFSEPLYMLLKSGDDPFKGKVYILMDEACFSAAGVFVAALKGLPNVVLAGVQTDGSSGRSKNAYLSNSNIRVKLSTMISFQRDGSTLDGNGTAPDLILYPDLEQVMNEKDTQLEQLLKHIEAKGTE